MVDPGTRAALTDLGRWPPQFSWGNPQPLVGRSEGADARGCSGGTESRGCSESAKLDGTSGEGELDGASGDEGELSGTSGDERELDGTNSRGHSGEPDGTSRGSGADSASYWNGAGSGADSASSWNGAGSGGDSASSWNGAGSGADSASSWNRAALGMPTAHTDTSGGSNTLAISPGQRGASADVVAILAGDTGVAGLAGMTREDSDLAGMT